MSETKACPYCGEQVLAVAIKCKHCGSAIGPATPVSAPPPDPVKKRPTLRPVFAVLGVIVAAIIAVSFIDNWQRTGTLSGVGFSDDDDARIEQSIRSEYSKSKGVTVEKVSMMRESPRKLTGFAKLKMPLVGEVTKDCTATMGDDGKSIWECK